MRRLLRLVGFYPDEHYFQDELRVAKANCPIAVPFNPEAMKSELGSHWELKYATRWLAVLDQSVNELPKLRDFRFADNWDLYGDGSWTFNAILWQGRFSSQNKLMVDHKLCLFLKDKTPQIRHRNYAEIRL